MVPDVQQLVEHSFLTYDQKLVEVSSAPFRLRCHLLPLSCFLLHPCARQWIWWIIPKRFCRGFDLGRGPCFPCCSQPS